MSERKVRVEQSWLPTLPTGWGTRRVKDLVSLINGYPFPSELFEAEGGVPLVRIRDIGRNTTETSFLGTPVTSALITSQDVLIGMDGDFTVGRWLGSRPALLNQRVCALRSRDAALLKYIEYALPYPLGIVNQLAYSTTVKHLSSGEVLHTRVPLPDDSRTLKNIVAFLDHETARIDELVREQERLRAQLLEKRSAVISASATTGLDDDALTRDSGVAWLGKLSSEWSLVRLLHVSRIRSGLVDPTDERFVDFTLIAPNHVESETGRLLELSTAREQGAISGKYRCYHGDVIYSKIRPALAKACLSPGDEVLCSADMYAIAPGERLLSEFLLLFLLSDAFTRFAVLESDRVAMPKINQESLKDCWIPLPPIHEQQAIVEQALAALKDVDALLDESNRLIDLLLERRAALISAAVTGQLDLRDWQSLELEAVAEVA